jgi:hypothetical protein
MACTGYSSIQILMTSERYERLPVVMGKKGFKRSSDNLFMNLFSSGLFFFDGYLLKTYKIKPVFSVLHMRYRFSVLQCFAPI